MNYHGVMAMDGPGGSVVSLPGVLRGELEPVLLATDASPTARASQLPAEKVSKVVGPAYIGYAEVVISSPRHQVQLLGPKDTAHVESLQQACDATEWEHGGSTVADAAVICGIFAGEKLASLAGYEIWDDRVAHISVITHPEHRGQGYGHSTVAFLAKHALWKKLLPQYRTLEVNTSSMAIAQAVGFEHFATSMAVRLNGAG